MGEAEALGVESTELKCDKGYERLIMAWFEPYCISAARDEPVAVAVQDRENYTTFCRSDNFRDCPFYRDDSIPPPADA